jgi:Tfp pilus assembly protein PilO
VKRLTPRETALIAIAAALAVIIPLYSLVFSPELAVLKIAGGHVAAQSHQIAGLNTDAGRLPALERDTAAVEAGLEQAEARIPATISVSGLMSRLSGAISASGVQLVEVTFPQGTVPAASAADPVQELPVAIRLRGTFEHVVAFMQRIESTPVIAEEQAIAVGGGTPPGDGTLDVTLTMKAIALH